MCSSVFALANERLPESSEASYAHTRPAVPTPIQLDRLLRENGISVARVASWLHEAPYISIYRPLGAMNMSL
jgi:hypothetical protein